MSDESSGTRRQFVGTTTAAVLAALAGCGGSDPTDTETEEPTPSDEGLTPTDEETATPTDEETDTDEGTETPTAAPDVPLLNYALTLEHLENAFYRDGLETFSDDELMNAEVLSPFGEQVRMEVPTYLGTVSAHEAAHVDALAGTIQQLGGEPLAEGEYDFGYDTPSEFLGVAQALENTGVAAYAGAAPEVVNADVLGAAAGIHSVEARHASVLNLLNGDAPYPDGVDAAASMADVLAVAGEFITSEVDPSAYELDPDRPTQSRKADDGTSDVEVLNYALGLEHLENAFYRGGLETFSAEEITTADALSEYDEELRTNLPGYLETAGAHEAAHVDALRSTIEQLNGDPVAEAEYDFGYETVGEFLGVAQAVENTGVAAYAGAAPSVANDDVFAAALGIHSVEARHAAILNEVTGTVPFPETVDQPLTMSEVGEIVSQFVVSE